MPEAKATLESVAVNPLKPRRRVFRARDYGRALGPRIAMIEFSAVVMIVAISALSPQRASWPADFAGNFLVFLPAALGLGTLSISLWAPRNARGGLLVALGLAPWLYAANLDAPDVGAIFVGVPASLPANGGIALFPDWLLFLVALVPALVVVRLRTLFPGRVGIRRAMRAAKYNVFLFFAGLIALAFARAEDGGEALTGWFTGPALWVTVPFVIGGLLAFLDIRFGPDGERFPPRPGTPLARRYVVPKYAHAARVLLLLTLGLLFLMWIRAAVGVPQDAEAGFGGLVLVGVYTYLLFAVLIGNVFVVSTGAIDLIINLIIFGDAPDAPTPKRTTPPSA